ncbi:MAG: NAD-dependent epimerase/dehydratase family protein, partial [Actinomycetota bacterium]|nr:NAD-dependent epimerase/dehydratase family protein [Actinomycetota bacterium]
DLERFTGAGEGDDWAVVWAAGAGVVGTTRTALDDEAELVRRFAAAVREKRPAGRGALFLSSSAGMYAGSAAPPFDERTEPRPMNAYGAVKLQQEHAVARELAGAAPLVVGRISTLYGPGQNLDKAQGLVTRLCLQAAMRRPIRVFVPMDTLRDYLFVDDAATMALGLLTEAVARQPADPQVRVMAAGQATSVAELVALVQRISRTRIGVVQAPTPANSQHVIDLRLRSQHPAPPGVAPRTLLATGVRRVYDDIMRQTAVGALAERHGHG